MVRVKSKWRYYFSPVAEFSGYLCLLFFSLFVAVVMGVLQRKEVYIPVFLPERFDVFGLKDIPGEFEYWAVLLFAFAMVGRAMWGMKIFLFDGEFLTEFRLLGGGVLKCASLSSMILLRREDKSSRFFVNSRP